MGLCIKDADLPPQAFTVHSEPLQVKALGNQGGRVRAVPNLRVASLAGLREPEKQECRSMTKAL